MSQELQAMDHNTIQDPTNLLDPIHMDVNPFTYPFSQEIWGMKYSNNNKDATNTDTLLRVSKAIASCEKEAVREHWQEAFYLAMASGCFVPAGRILAGAGTSNRVTLVNCFVNRTVEDSMEGIIGDALKDTALTMQQGGGMGTDFSTLRPSGAYLSRTGSEASGPIPFMHTWDAMCKTIMSAGSRRGAMMATMSCTHPDLLNFIQAKIEGKALRMFNISVLVTDAFMHAVRDDEEWILSFPKPPVGPVESFETIVRENGVMEYVYSKHRAKDIWALIMKTTYAHAEPGVIFIDRVNKMNNLRYLENIQCTNPCVTGDTPILTRQGYVPIKAVEGSEVEIWNGERWSSVTPFSTGINALMELEFSNGQTLQCTPYHGFFQQGQRIDACKLKIGDKLDWADMPVVDLPALGGYDYSQGFFAGDGNDGGVSSKVYFPKYPVMDALRGSFGEEQSLRGTWINWYHGEMLPRYSVPINGSIEEAITWLSGYLDADGCIEVKGQSLALTASAKDQKFLQDVGLMLTRLGCNCRIWDRKDGGEKIVSGVKTTFQNTYNLTLNMHDVARLKELGLRTYRLDLARFWEPAGIAKVGNRVTAVRQLHGHQETFCFTDPDLGAGVFNGVHTANCGEQPLPPFGACNLGAVNLARMVLDPFTPKARVNKGALKATIQIAMRFLDNVIDVSAYPLPEQAEEQRQKRRIGLGIMGLADMLIQMGIVYGSSECDGFLDDLAAEFMRDAYQASIQLAIERGSFPAYSEGFLQSKFLADTPELLDQIAEYGIRNGVLLTIAPTGTTSIYVGNVVGGLEPTFAHTYERKVLQNDDTYATTVVSSYTYRLAQDIGIPTTGPEWVTAQTLPVGAHLKVQSIWQSHIDASISKTINCPADITEDDFASVYMFAWEQGCKGCTTYRPSEGRGEVMKVISDKPDTAVAKVSLHTPPEPMPRPDILQGETRKLKWPGLSSAVYMTVNFTSDRRPFELFFSSKDNKHQEWMAALSLSLTSLFRLGVDTTFIFKEFQQVTSAGDSAFKDGRRYDSFLAYIGTQLDEAINGVALNAPTGAKCPDCGEYAVVVSGGCPTCTVCGSSKCG